MADESPFTLEERFVRSAGYLSDTILVMPWIKFVANLGKGLKRICCYCGIWKNYSSIVKKNVSQNMASHNTMQRRWRKAHRCIGYIRYMNG